MRHQPFGHAGTYRGVKGCKEEAFANYGSSEEVYSEYYPVMHRDQNGAVVAPDFGTSRHKKEFHDELKANLMVFHGLGNATQKIDSCSCSRR